MKKLNESLDWHDMEDQVTPTLSIDEFSSRTGDDSSIIVLAFLVASQAAAEDLMNWFERGYEWIIDSEVSPGQVLNKKYYVFAELNRTTSAGKRIVELLADLETLTGKKVSDWTLKLEDGKHPASLQAIERGVVLNPTEYKKRQESELNEWRQAAGLPVVQTYDPDPQLVAWQRQAGIK